MRCAKKPLERVMLSSARHRKLCSMPAGEWSSTHTCICPTLLLSVQGMGEFLFKEIHSLAKPVRARTGQGRAVLAAFLSFLLSFLIIFLDVFPAFPCCCCSLKNLHTHTHTCIHLATPPTPHSLACCFAIPLKVAAFSSSPSHSQSVNLCLCWKFDSTLLLLCFPL